MTKRWLSKHWISLLTRMLVFFAIVGTIVNLAIWSIFAMFRDRVPGALPRSISSVYSSSVSPVSDDLPMAYEMVFRIRFAQELMNSIAKDPSQEAFLRAAQDEGLEARFESPEQKWSTDSSLPQVKQAMHFGQSVWPFSAYRVTETTIAREDGHVHWLIKFPAAWRTGVLHDPRVFLVLMINVMTMLIMSSLFYIFQLRPLRELRRGITEFSSGNLGHQIPITQNSELGDLGSAFNQMSQRLQNLVQTKEELISAVSHELRSPLTRMRLAVEVEGEKSLPRIRKNIEEVERLIGDILETRYMESPNAELNKDPFQLQDLFTTIHGDPSRIQISLPPKNSMVFGDRKQLQRVIENLVENALKYSKGSTNPILVETMIAKSGLTIRVRDHGPGVPPQMLSRIFEPFFRVDQSRNHATGGFGFGLYLCQRIVEAHGGTIHANNMESGGLVITVFLPQRTHNQSPTLS